MDEVFVNQEAHPCVIEADGALDLAALQLQPATVVINGSVIIYPYIYTPCRRQNLACSMMLNAARRA